MPNVKLEISQVTLEQKRELAKEYTNITSKITGFPPEAITIIIDEYGKDNIAVNGVLLSDKK